MARAQRTKSQNLEVNSSGSAINKDPTQKSVNNQVVTDDWDDRPFPDLLDCHAAQANSYLTAETSLNMSEQTQQTSLNMSVQVQQQPSQQPPPPPFTVRI